MFWRRDLGVTLLITVVTVVVELVLGFALALVMHKALKSVRGLLRTAILVPYGIITVVSAFAWFYAFDINSGFVNNWFDWVPGIDPDLNWFAQDVDLAVRHHGLGDLEDHAVHLAAAAGRPGAGAGRADRGRGGRRRHLVGADAAG